MKITDEMVEAAKEAYRKPRYMIPNTSEGSLTTRIYSALEAALNVVPDAVTERVTENSVRHVKNLTTELQNKRESLNDQRREFRKLLAKARAERDDALAVIECVRTLHEPITHYSGWVTCHYCMDDNRQTATWPCKTALALDGAPEPGLSESERLEIEGTPYVWSPDSLAYQLDGWVNDLGIPGNSMLEEFGVQEGVYYEDQSVLSEKLQEVTIAWLEEHGYRRDGAPEPVKVLYRSSEIREAVNVLDQLNAEGRVDDFAYDEMRSAIESIHDCESATAVPHDEHIDHSELIAEAREHYPALFRAPGARQLIDRLADALEGKNR